MTMRLTSYRANAGVALARMVLCLALTLFISLPNQVHAADGDLDTSFGGDGKVTTDFGGNGIVHDVALQADGKIVAVGWGGARPDFALVRYNTDGTLDSTFGAGGKVTTDFGGGAGAQAVALQSDGKIVAVGYGIVSGSHTFALARYNTDGSLDSTFGAGGKVTTDFGDIDTLAGANAVALQADGKIVAAGRTYTVNVNGSFALARYNTDGSLDSTFGAGGKVTTDFGAGAVANAVALQADGKIVAAGVAFIGFGLARFNTDGSLDSTFGAGGEVTTVIDFGSGANAVALQADGKIVAAGFATIGHSFGLARYNADGSLDSTFGSAALFGTAGVVFTVFGGTFANLTGANAVALQADGKIVAAGYTFGVGSDHLFHFALARYNMDGSLDSTFGSGGQVTTDSDEWEVARAIALQADGKIVAAGYRSHSFHLARYKAVINTPPIANAGPDQTLECTSPTGASVTLDGSGSSDLDGDSLSYTWTGFFGTAGEVSPTVSLSLGTHLVTLTVSDGKATATDTVLITVQDTTPPAIFRPPDVTVEATGPSGQVVAIGTATATDHCDSSPTITNDAPAIFPIGTTIVTWTATDVSGNRSTATQRVTVQDTIPPVISLTNPGPETYGCTLTIAFGATDSGTGVANVSATLNGTPVSNGQTATLTKPGLNTLSVTATDLAGNTSTQTVTFSVTYNFIGFLPPINNDGSSYFKLGSTVPIKYQLTDCTGLPVTTATGTLAVFKIADIVLGTVEEVSVDSSGNANTDNLFRYGAPNYIYNLGTTPYTQGTYRLQVSLDDGTIHTADISLKAK